MNDKEKISGWERFKYKLKNADLKTLLKAVILLFGVGIIVLMTVVHVELQPENFDFYSWLTKTILLVGISVFGILMGESIGKDKQMANPNGMYQRAIAEYDKSIGKVKPILLYFNDFLTWYRAKETEKKEIDFLLNHGIKDAKLIVDNVTKIDFKELNEHPIKLETGDVILQKSDDEIEIINEIVSGNVIVKSYSSAYYMSAFETHTGKSDLEVPFQLDKDIKFNKRFSRTFKIISFIAVSLIVGMLGVKDMMQGNDLMAWWDLGIRIFTMFSCLFSGWGTSVIGVKLEALKIKNKISILEKFDISYSTREFVPTDYQDLARKDYEEYLKTLEVEDGETDREE